MDLHISPDFDARWCYAVAIVAGVATAIIQVRGMLPKAPVAWLVPGAWVLLGAYTAIPPALFWILDRSGAVNDTSLFAALLVGVAYPQILAGKQEGITTPANVSALWSPFLKWANSIVPRVTEVVQISDRKFRESCVREITSDQNLMTRWINLSRLLCTDVGIFDGELQAIDQQADVLGADLVRRRKAVLAVDTISHTTRYMEAILHAGLIGAREYYWWNFLGWFGVRTAAILFLSVVALAVGIGEIAAHSSSITYHIWRLEKPYSSKMDQFRAREALSAALADNQTASEALHEIAVRLKRPDLAVDRLEHFLAVLLQHRDSGVISSDLPAILIATLRADSVDCRTRVNSALLLLAREKAGAEGLPKDFTLKDWKPTEVDSVEQLEERIGQWCSIFGLEARIELGKGLAIPPPTRPLNQLPKNSVSRPVPASKPSASQRSSPASTPKIK
jgi:hypothetical protein